jgi:hypothetical protein
MRGPLGTAIRERHSRKRELRNNRGRDLLDLLHLNARKLDHFTQLLGILGDELAEFVG